MSDQFDPYYTWLGIPPEDQPPDYYRLLGIRRFENNPEVISNTLGQRLAHIRSFQSGERAAAAKQVLDELDLAGACLTNPEKKGAYDRELRQKDAPKLARSHSSPQIAKPLAPHKSSPSVPVLPPGSGAPPVQTSPRPAFTAAPAARPPVVAKAAPNMPVVVTQPSVPMVVNPSTTFAASKSPAPWLPIALVAGGGAMVLLLGGFVILGVAVGLGLFSGKSKEEVAQKSDKEKVKSKEPITVVKPKETIPRKNPVLSTGANDNNSGGTKPTGVNDNPSGLKPLIDTVALAPIEANLGEPLDLLQDFDKTKQVERGSVRKTIDGWQTNGVGTDMLVFHVGELPQEYMVEAIITRQRDTTRYRDEGLMQGLVVGDRQCMVTVDGFNPQGMRTALDLIDGERAGKQMDACEFRGQLLTRRQRTNMRYYVFKDRVAVECNGKTVLNWTGGLDRLSLEPTFKTSDDKALFFATWNGSFVLNKLEIRAIGEAGSPPPEALVVNIPKSPGSNPAEEPEPEVSSPQPEPVKETKFTTPAQADRDKALATIQATYKTEFSKFVKPQEKVDFADTLLVAAKDEAVPATLYSLLAEARRLKLEAGDMSGAFLVVDRLTSKFEGDPWKERALSLKLAQKEADSAGEKKALAEISRRITEGALAAAQFDAASEAAAVAVVAAERMGAPPAVRKEFTALKLAAEEGKTQHEAAKSAFEKLKGTPDDAAANETCGKFVCLMKRDWKQGLPYLVKAQDATLKTIAEQDVADPAAAPEQIALGDKWWDAANSGSFKGREQDSLKLRARDWYEKAIPTATGLARITTQKRLDETAALAAASSVSSTATPAIAGATPGTLGRLVIDGRSAFLVKYEPGAQLDKDSVKKLLEIRNKRGSSFEMIVEGFIHLDEATDVNIRNTAGDAFGGTTVQLKIGIPPEDVGSLPGVSRESGDVYKVPLKKGEHHFAWTIKGSVSGSKACELSFTSADSGDPLYVYYNNNINTRARQLPVMNAEKDVVFAK